jgi:hypothetical protein
MTTFWRLAPWLARIPLVIAVGFFLFLARAVARRPSERRVLTESGIKLDSPMAATNLRGTGALFVPLAGILVYCDEQLAARTCKPRFLRSRRGNREQRACGGGRGAGPPQRLDRRGGETVEPAGRAPSRRPWRTGVRYERSWVQSILGEQRSCPHSVPARQ